MSLGEETSHAVMQAGWLPRKQVHRKGYGALEGRQLNMRPQCAFAANKASCILNSVTVLPEGPGKWPCPYVPCETTSSVLLPGWYSPVQEGYWHTKVVPTMATKLIRGLANMTCEKRLRKLCLLILEKRWLGRHLLVLYNCFFREDREDWCWHMAQPHGQTDGSG